MAGLIRSAVKSADQKVDDLFDRLRGNRGADKLFYGASKAAEFSMVWHALSLVGAAFVPSLRNHSLRLSVALGFESVIVNLMIKPIFNRQRPDLIEGAPHLRRPRSASFPSGHASSATMAAVLLGDAVPILKPLWWSAAAVVAGSRIHARMHHGSDVGAGVLVGWVLGYIVKRLRPL